MLRFHLTNNKLYLDYHGHAGIFPVLMSGPNYIASTIAKIMYRNDFYLHVRDDSSYIHVRDDSSYRMIAVRDDSGYR